MDIQAKRANFMQKLAQAILRMNDLNKFLSSLTEMVVETFKLSWATLSLMDETRGQYTPKASSQSKNTTDPNCQNMSRIDNTVSWLKERQKIVASRLLEEFGSQMAPALRDELEKSNTCVSLPLFAGEQLMGILNLGAKSDVEPLSREDLAIISQGAEVLAAIINQAVSYQKLIQQRLHHQNILDNLVSGIVVIDVEDKITVFNRTAERILKFTAEQVLGKNVLMLQTNLANLILDTLHKDKSYRREELYILPENTLIGVSTSQFYDAKGNLLGAYMVFSNLAEIKREEKSHRQKELHTYWSNVANSLAHEVKNSIVATKVFAEMFPQKYEDAEFRWSLYSALKRDMEELDNFTERMLEFAQPKELTIQSCQINKIMDAAINAVLQDQDCGAISFEKRYNYELAPVAGDYHQLKDAFAQIMSNALEAMDKKGTLSISIDQESNPQMLIYNLPEAIKELPQDCSIVVVKIKDTGCGIIPQDISRLFDPFFTTKEGRTGLGLARARKIVERHKGIISVESKQGQGSTFWVCLPTLKQTFKPKHS